ncbi:MAG TPA: bacteriohopanetetrol glucosamine biosynthesis glycosyltransferase HpnI [Terriglobales bacterium]|nr:bacteriohopanetetrol glucosamine biosynthesis glycosyltransferase HpnI [Terriglobales bacterium]
MFIRTLLAIAMVGTISSTAFLILVIAGVLRFIKRRRQQRSASDYIVPVSVLKPLHGLEPNLEENLESFFIQDYPDFELIFCARDLSDPALQVALRLSKKHQRVQVRILTSGEPPWTNAKLYSLEKMWREASYDLFVISDSDVRVSPHYLRQIIKPFANPKVGMTTCLYRGLPAGGFWTELEALGFSVEMSAGVVVADLLEGMKFALGPTMTVRRQCIDALGGFGFMADYCADDYILGNRVADSGMEVVLSHHCIDHMVFHHSFLASMRHQVRWMRSTRFSRPKGHLGTILTYAMPYGVIGLVAGLASSHAVLGWSLLGAAFLNRVIQSVAAGYVVAEDRRALTHAWLYPVRDLLGAVLWLGSYLSAKIDWRGETYRLSSGGLMLRAQSRKANTKATKGKTKNHEEEICDFKTYPS